MTPENIKGILSEEAKSIRKTVPLVGTATVSSQEKVAEASCVTRQAISKLENGNIGLDFARYYEPLGLFGVILGMMLYPDPRLKNDKYNYAIRAAKCMEINCRLLGLPEESVKKIMEIMEDATK